MRDFTGEPWLVIEISEGLSISVDIDAWVVPIILMAMLCAIAWVWLRGWMYYRSFELNYAEFGLGNTKVSFSPNRMDRQIAYAIWVELSTRKIGLEIDPEHDVISEVYDSWYTFFGVTRDLIKEVPAHKLRNKSTRAIVRTSVQVLNLGVRPHLTHWQARYRRWFDAVDPQDTGEPQMIQRKFPKYDELLADLLTINARLIRYRKVMYELATGDQEGTIEINSLGKSSDQD